MEDSWRETLKKRPVRTWSRVEIEEIIKERHIDRTRFGEYSKSAYQTVINRFYYAFTEHNSNSTVRVQGTWNKIRNSLSKVEFVSEGSGWNEMLASMKASVLTYCDTKCFLLLDDGWLYEGYIDEIIEVLREIDGFIDAFYIFTNRYDVLFSYSGDSRGYVLYR